MSEAEFEDTIARLRKGWAMQQAEAATPDPEYQAARAALEARLPAYENADRDCGIAAGEAIGDEAETEVNDAQRAMFETTPTTPAGAAALVRLAMEHLDELGINDRLIEDVFTDAIRNAVAVLERGEARA
jgi:hypothetical protein